MITVELIYTTEDLEFHKNNFTTVIPYEKGCIFNAKEDEYLSDKYMDQLDEIIIGDILDFENAEKWPVFMAYDPLYPERSEFITTEANAYNFIRYFLDVAHAAAYKIGSRLCLAQYNTRNKRARHIEIVRLTDEGSQQYSHCLAVNEYSAGELAYGLYKLPDFYTSVFMKG